MKPKIPLHRKYGGTFFIFPVFLPLAELLPWALTIIAALAAAVQVFSRAIWNHKRNRRILLAVSILCLLAAAIMVARRIAYTPAADEGSELLAASAFSHLQRFERQPSPPSTAAKIPLAMLWKTNAPNQNIAKPAIIGGLLMVGTYKATLDALSVSDGQPVWTLHKHEQVFSTPNASETIAFVGEGHHTSPASVLTAFSLPDGKPLWERKFRSHLESYPAIDEAHDRIFMAAGEVGIWALGEHDGKKLWWAPVGHSDITPLYTGATVFAAAKLREDADGSALFTLDADTGKVLHSIPLNGDPMCGLMAASNGVILLGTAIGQVGVKRATDAGWAYGFNADGSQRWMTKLPAMPLPEGVMNKNRSFLFFTLNNGSLIALDADNGHVLWQAEVGKAFQTDATLMEDGKLPLITAVTSEGYVTIREAMTGHEITHFSITPGDSYPLYHDHILYISTPYDMRAYRGMVP